jgi:hypothetical protein
MKRYFFDVNFQSHIEYDFAGQCFPSAEEAREMAEMIALDVACADKGNGNGVEVQVRTVVGYRIFSIPVRKREAVAA